MKLTFPLPPNLANRRMHWAYRHRLHGDWKLAAVALERKLRRKDRPDEPHEKITISATLYVHQRMDLDNAVARLKWCIDMLVMCGIVVDDGPDHVTYTGMPDQVIDRDHQRVELIVEAA